MRDLDDLIDQANELVALVRVVGDPPDAAPMPEYEPTTLGGWVARGLFEELDKHPPRTYITFPDPGFSALSTARKNLSRLVRDAREGYTVTVYKTDQPGMYAAAIVPQMPRPA